MSSNRTASIRIKRSWQWHYWADNGFTVHVGYRPYRRVWPEIAFSFKWGMIGFFSCCGPYILDIFWSKP